MIHAIYMPFDIMYILLHVVCTVSSLNKPSNNDIEIEILSDIGTVQFSANELF